MIARRLLIAGSILVLACASMAQDASNYLRLRKQLGVKRPVTVEELGKLTGSHAIEIKGRVKGTFKVGAKDSILIERADGGSDMIEADSVPDWLQSNDVPARLLVRATRTDEYASMHATLIAAAPEDSVSRFDVQATPKATATTRPASTPASRGGSPLRGQIGRHGSYTKNAVPAKWNLPASKATPIYASFIKHENPKLSDNEAYRIAQAIIGFSLKYGVDPRLIMAVVMVESGFDPSSTSSAGAQGLGQLMPDTAKWMGVSNSYDVFQNLGGSVKLMRYHLMDYRSQTGDNFKSLILALAAYNAGMGAVKRAGGIPYGSTQRYVEHVVTLYRQFCGQ